jgi:transposase InsO family protein
MRLHSNAKTTPKGRRLMVQRVLHEGWRRREAAQAAGVSVRTVGKWVARFRVEGAHGLLDRSSRPHQMPRKTSEKRVQAIVHLRRKRYTAWQIAQRLAMPWSTVSKILQRQKLGKRAALTVRKPPRRYEYAQAGGLLHLDIKRLGRFDHPGHRIHRDRSQRCRGAGWDYVHVAVDDASRISYVEVLADQKGETARAFFERARTWFQAEGVTVQRVLTDNGSCYVSRRFRQACKRVGVKHIRTRPYHPQTNGKAERFIQTLLHSWAYGRAYCSAAERTRRLPRWVRYYNERRPHRSLGMIPPITHLQEVL